ncbi:MAG: YhcH/YjgK/YiaL family protein [Acutalibacteraceae bacterium]|nr:YhcH/YjgK/YiaL family protein [Acutalibacteraceae bacterium]
MIVTDYRNLEFYSEVPHAKEVIDFIDGFKKTEMKPGRYDILGDELFAAVSRYDTEPREDRRFESHRKYIDIQIVLDGNEELDWAETSSLEMTDNGFERGDDIAFYDGETLSTVILGKEQCAVLFPEDGHRPNVMHKEIENVLKIVFKIKK